MATEALIEPGPEPRAVFITPGADLPELFVLQQDTWPTAWLPLSSKLPVAEAADVHKAEGKSGPRWSCVKAQMSMGRQRITGG